jgi:hypothetical protein
MIHEEEIEHQWLRVAHYFKTLTGKKPDLNGVLFLIGIQELGKGIREFSKEQKQDLMHIGTCAVLTKSGYYTPEGRDEDGWPHWKLSKKMPMLTLEEQEQFLKIHVIEYMRDEIGNV